MEQFVLVPASLLNKLNTTKSTTVKVDLPKYQPQQTPTSQVDSLKKDINKKFIGLRLLEADSLVDKLLASPRIKLSLSNTIVLDGTDTGVLLHDCAQLLRRKNADVPDIYFTLLDAADISPRIVLNQNAKAKERGNWISFKI